MSLDMKNRFLISGDLRNALIDPKISRLSPWPIPYHDIKYQSPSLFHAQKSWRQTHMKSCPFHAFWQRTKRVYLTRRSCQFLILHASSSANYVVLLLGRTVDTHTQTEEPTTVLLPTFLGATINKRNPWDYIAHTSVMENYFLYSYTLEKT